MKNYSTYFWRRLIIYVSILVVPALAKAQYIENGFAGAGVWTNGANGNNYPTLNGTGNSNWQGAPGAAWNYIFRPLGFPLAAGTAWTTDFAFFAAVGNCPAHTLMSLTDVSTNSWNSAPPGYPVSSVDAVEVYIAAANCAGAPWPLYANSKDVQTWGTPTTPIMITPGNIYYIRLQRFDATHGMLSVFSDATYTTHIAGSPQCFTISANVGTLNFAQQGCIPQGGNFRNLYANFWNLNIYANNWCEYYTHNVSWTTAGSNISVTGGTAYFNGCSAGADNRMSKYIGPTIRNSAQWVTETEFRPSQISLLGAGNGILCLSEGNTANLWNIAAAQDGVAAYLMGTGNNMLLFAESRDGTTWNGASSPITLPSNNTTYYLRLERCGTNGVLNVYSDAARTTHISGSPQTFGIPVNVNNLQYLSHCGMQNLTLAQWLTGTVDNTCIYGYMATAGTIGYDQGICTGVTPAPFVSLSGTGCCTYQWERETPAGSGNWQSVVGATGSTYAAPPITQNTCYRRRATFNCGSMSAYSNTVCLTINCRLAYHGSDENLTIMPNPTNGEFTISFGNTDFVRDVDIINLIGEVVYTQTNVTTSTLQIDLSTLPKGVYIVRCKENGNTYHQRVVIQ
jgi:hypothetical protein